jgi:hypothetical protein
LKKVQSLYETPLRFPNEIDLHSEGEDVIPNKQCTRCDCNGNQNTGFVFPMTTLTGKILEIGRWINSAKWGALGEYSLLPISRRGAQEMKAQDGKG